MLFFLGLIVGLLIAILIFLVQIFFRNKIIKSFDNIMSKIEKKEKGEIFMPTSENQIKLEKGYDIM